MASYTDTDIKTHLETPRDHKQVMQNFREKTNEPLFKLVPKAQTPTGDLQSHKLAFYTHLSSALITYFISILMTL